GLGTHLCRKDLAERVGLSHQIVQRLSPAIEQGNHGGAGSAHQIHGERGFLRTVWHGGKAVRDLGHHLRGGLERPVRIGDGNPELLKSLSPLAYALCRVVHVLGQAANTSPELIERDTGEIGGILQRGQLLNRYAEPLRRLSHVVGGVDGAPYGKAKARQGGTRSSGTSHKALLDYRAELL